MVNQRVKFSLKYRPPTVYIPEPQTETEKHCKLRFDELRQWFTDFENELRDLMPSYEEMRRIGAPVHDNRRTLIKEILGDSL